MTQSFFTQKNIGIMTISLLLVFSVGYYMLFMKPIPKSKMGTGIEGSSSTLTPPDTSSTPEPDPEPEPEPEPEPQRVQIDICEGFNATHLTISKNDFWIEMSIQDLLEKINQKMNGQNNHVVYLKKWPLRITNATVKDINRKASGFHSFPWLLLKMNQNDTSIPPHLRSPYTVLVIFPEDKGWDKQLESIQPGVIVTIDCTIDSLLQARATIDIHIMCIVDGYRLIEGNRTLIP